MQIGIIGTGNMGGNLGRLWAAKGHRIMFGSRDPHKTLPALSNKQVGIGTIADGAKFGEAVLLATPWHATQEIIQHAGSLEGKILIDCTNPLTPDFMSLTLGFNTSGAEEIAKWAPGARVVKAFNSIAAGVLSKPNFGAQPATAFYCGDDASAKKVVAQLAAEIGFEAIDVGSLKNARLLEPLALLFVQLAFGQGMGPELAWKLLRR